MTTEIIRHEIVDHPALWYMTGTEIGQIYQKLIGADVPRMQKILQELDHQLLLA